MSDAIKKITVNIPEQLLKSAVSATGRGITETVIEGLQEIEKREKRSALRALRGKIRIDLDLKRTRR